MCESAINRAIDPSYGRLSSPTALVIPSVAQAQREARAPVLNDVTTESTDARAAGGRRGRKALRINLDEEAPAVGNGLTIPT